MKKKSNYFYANLIYLIIILGFVTIRILSSLDIFSFLNGADDYVMSIILQIGLMLILPIFLFSGFTKRKPKETIKYYGIKKISFIAIGISVLIGIIVYFLNIGVASFFNSIIEFFGYEKFTSSAPAENYPFYMLFVNLTMTALLPAICEEVTHRGLLLKNYSTLGYKKAILISSLLFGLTHLNIEQFFFATIIGLLLGTITVLTGNIIPAMIVHFMNNAINVVAGYLLATSQTFNAGYQAFWSRISSGNFFVVITSIFFVLSLLILLLGYLIYKLFQHTTVKDLKKTTEELSRKALRDELMGEISIEQPSEEKIPMLVQRENRFFNIYLPADSIGYPIKQQYFPALKEKAIFYGMLTITSLITLFSFIWNIL